MLHMHGAQSRGHFGLCAQLLRDLHRLVDKVCPECLFTHVKVHSFDGHGLFINKCAVFSLCLYLYCNGWRQVPLNKKAPHGCAWQTKMKN